MDLYVETLAGTAFEVRVSQFETVISVKAKIQRQEGIPISQQHLIWQSVELEDDNCLHDYSINDGATLKLVLAMRGGPINTRRVPVEDPALREMADYMEANRDELLDKIPGNRQVTLLVYKEGDQLNFFRVVDRGDGTLTPLSESLSGASVYNLCDEEDDSEGSAGLRDKGDENDKTKEKMKLLRTKMADLSITRKPKKPKPRPPSSGRPGSRSRRFHHYSYPSGKTPGRVSLSSKNILPPVGQVLPEKEGPSTRLEVKPSNGASINHLLSKDHMGMPLNMTQLSKVTESVSTKDHRSIPALRAVHNLPSAPKGLRTPSEVSSAVPQTSGPLDSCSVPSSKVEVPSNPPNSLNRVPGLTRLLSHDGVQHSSKDFPLELLPRPPSSAKPPGVSERQKGLILESLSQQEARGLLLTQASLERLGSSNISNFVPSASKSQVSGFPLKDQGHVPPPEGRLLSARLRISNSREGRISPSAKLPPVKQKKKSKRCFFCTKKTGLANSYVCRCGNNYCATHRYAEVHNCPFDYKTEGRKLLEQSNPVVSAPKLPKI